MLAAYSKNYLVADSETPFLSVVVNFVLIPVRYIKGLFASDEFYTGPQMEALGINHVFEHEAIEIFFVVGLLLGCAALFIAVKAVKSQEDSIWYTNAIFASLISLFLVNNQLGLLVTAAALLTVFKIRGEI